MQTEEIINLALELGNAIAGSDEIRQLKEVQARLSEDAAAYDLVTRYQDAMNQMEHKMEDGLPVSKIEEDHLDILEQQINSNAVILELVNAQEKFNHLMQSIYYTINQAVSGGCSEGCDSCGGICM